jgi:hypothetical protein
MIKDKLSQPPNKLNNKFCEETETSEVYLYFVAKRIARLFSRNMSNSNFLSISIYTHILVHGLSGSHHAAGG